MKFPRCCDCGGEVILKSGKGRTREYIRGILFLIPENYELPTCVDCDEIFMSLDFSEPLDKLFAEWLKNEIK